MFLEAVGKFCFSQMRPIFLFSLLMAPLLFTSFFLASQISHLQDLEIQFEQLEKKALPAYGKKERQTRFLARYGNPDPFYLDHKIESLSFLESELHVLKTLFAHPAVANKTPLFERIQFLSGEKNRIAFLEEEIRRGPSIKETMEKQRFPVQMNEADLKKLLSLCEGLPEPEGNRPQLLITDFRLQKKLSPLQAEIFEVEIELLKREFS